MIEDGEVIGAVELTVRTPPDPLALERERDQLKMDLARANVAHNNAEAECDRLRARIAELEAQLAAQNA